jgi:hypothetical protein
VDDETDVFIVSVRGESFRGHYYLHARWDVAAVSDAVVYHLLVDIVRDGGGSVVGVHRLSPICKCHEEYEAEATGVRSEAKKGSR